MAASTTIVINNKQDRDRAQTAIMAIRSEPKMTVTIAPYVDSRSAAQNRLLWAWCTDMQRTTVNEHAGNTKNWWLHYFKEHSLLNIYIRDNVDGTAETMAALYDVKINCGVDAYNSMKSFVIKNISTTDANVPQFTEFLSDIQRWCGSVGIALRTDSADFRRAMGVK